MFAEFTAVKTPGKVVWCNFELAREMGFDVPKSNRMTPALERTLIEALSVRALDRREPAGDRETITMYADKYSGVYPALGACRAGFLPYGNIYIKGLGLTPLFKRAADDDFSHIHGCLPLDEALVEALLGEVNSNLFTLGSTRILAVIDQGRQIVHPDGSRQAAAIAARVGMQLRPGHLLSSQIRRDRSFLRVFINIVTETGQGIWRTEQGAAFLDARATMLKIIDDHALTAAEQYRWRMLHGAISASNMEMSGAMLDLPTQSTQPRTSAIWVLKFPNAVFGKEHIDRATELEPLYRELRRNIPRGLRRACNAAPIDVEAEMQAAYQRHLEVRLICATGIAEELAERIQRRRPELSASFTGIVVNLAALRNRANLNANKITGEQGSVVDVFALLRDLPALWTTTSTGCDLIDLARQSLKPVFKGNRFHAASKQAKLESLLSQLVESYGRLLTACESENGVRFHDRREMLNRAASKAQFENEPISLLYRSAIYKLVGAEIAAYGSSGEKSLLQERVDRWIAQSIRSLNGILRRTMPVLNETRSPKTRRPSGTLTRIYQLALSDKQELLKLLIAQSPIRQDRKRKNAGVQKTRAARKYAAKINQ